MTKDLSYFDVPALSVSGASLVLRSRPQYWMQSPFNPKRKADPPPTDSMERGTILHAMILEGKPLDSLVRIVGADDWRSAPAKAARQEIKEFGYIPLLRHEVQDIIDAAQAISEQVQSMAIWHKECFRSIEWPFYWSEYGNGFQMPCKGKADCVIDRGNGRFHIVDLKTTKNLKVDRLRFMARDYDWAMRAAAYCAGWEAWLRDKGFMWSDNPNSVIEVSYTYIIADIEPPYEVIEMPVPAESMTLGAQDWNRAVSIVADLRDRASLSLDPSAYPGSKVRCIPLREEWAMRATHMAIQGYDEAMEGQ